MSFAWRSRIDGERAELGKGAPRILFVLGGPLDTGGAEKQLTLLLPQLKRRGYDVHLLCLDGPGELAPELAMKGIGVSVLTARAGHSRGFLGRKLHAIVALLKTAAMIHRFQPAVIHFFSPKAYAIAGTMSLGFSNVRRVMSRRGQNRYLQGRPLLQRFERFLHQRMSVLLGNAKCIADELVAEGAPIRRVALIYNGIDLSRFANMPDRVASRSWLGVSPKTLLFVKVANLWGYKGHADLLDAFAIMRVDSDWRLLFVGRDEGAERGLRERAARLGIEEKVIFLGKTDRIGEVLAASDVGISASHEEGLSNAVLEYLAAGLAVVVTDVGGNAEAVGDAGVVVPPSDPSALRAALEAMSDENVRSRIAARARGRSQLFSMERSAEAYAALYRSLLEGDELPKCVQTVKGESVSARPDTAGAA